MREDSSLLEVGSEGARGSLVEKGEDLILVLTRAPENTREDIGQDLTQDHPLDQGADPETEITKKSQENRDLKINFTSKNIRN